MAGQANRIQPLQIREEGVLVDGVVPFVVPVKGVRSREEVEGVQIPQPHPIEEPVGRHPNPAERVVVLPMVVGLRPHAWVEKSGRYHDELGAAAGRTRQLLVYARGEKGSWCAFARLGDDLRHDFAALGQAHHRGVKEQVAAAVPLVRERHALEVAQIEQKDRVRVRVDAAVIIERNEANQVGKCHRKP